MYNCVMSCCVINNSNTTHEALSHNAWCHVIHHTMSCCEVHYVMLQNAWCHATECIMPSHAMHYAMTGMCNTMTCNAWCMMQLCDACHTARDALSHPHRQTYTCVTHKYTHGGFCIEQTTVSWRTRIYAKNCKKCGKTFVSLAMLKTLPCDKIKSFVNFKLSFIRGDTRSY